MRLTDGSIAMVLQTLYQSIVIKKELSFKAKLSVHPSIYVPTLTSGNKPAYTHQVFTVKLVLFVILKNKTEFQSSCDVASFLKTFFVFSFNQLLKFG